MKAQINSVFDSGAIETLKDENGGIWRVCLDDATGFYAVEEIEVYAGGPMIPYIEDAEVIRCGIARAEIDDSFNIYPSAEGQAKTFGVNCDDEFVATANGWKMNEEAG